MRSALNARLISGRHRLGLPDLVPVSSFVTVIRRNVFLRMFRSGRHRWTGRIAATPGVVTKLPTPAGAAVRATELHAA